MAHKNILLVISKFQPEYSGPGVRIPRLYDWLKTQGQGYKFKVLCNGVDQTKSEKYNHNGLEVQRIVAGYLHLKILPDRLKKFLIYQTEFVQCFLALLFDRNYKDTDLIHLAGHSGGTAAALLWAKIRHLPVLMELVTEHARHQQKIFGVFPISVGSHSKVIALTDKARKGCIFLGLSDDKIWCRPNPIDEEIFYPDFLNKENRLQKMVPSLTGKKLIVNVAKFMPQKNQILILKILPHLPDNFGAVLAGPIVKEGPLMARDRQYITEMERFIDQYKLQDKVVLIKDFVQAADFMKLADVYVMPAYNEGFGTPMLEAMACGVPVVANKDEAAFQEWIEPGKNGFLCDIQSPEDWARAIIKACAFERGQCLDIADEIRKKAGQRHIYGQYKAIIEELAGA